MCLKQVFFENRTLSGLVKLNVFDAFKIIPLCLVSCECVKIKPHSAGFSPDYPRKQTFGEAVKSPQNQSI